ncbi:hypothetical protein HIM_11811 [Hirsutella minnesotensis 3608]|uniref:Uncharacterized protein n=1 Tax=Hirsutella minnesotensis 3608 TaxID=1043627 RepID=A0A0F7ZWD7_9HYPO|nr:hypothetical protein HIM_11811 [Hirsutella minnesotensis 3608]
MIGVTKLWWSNRKSCKYEIIEEERRSRLAEMRQCVIESLRVNEIPFGVRAALESGVEVEGIWLSRSNTPDGYHTASSTAPIDGKLPSKGKERTIDPWCAGFPASPAANDRLAAPSPTRSGHLPEQSRDRAYTPTAPADALRIQGTRPSSSGVKSPFPLYAEAQQHLLAGSTSDAHNGDIPHDASLYGVAEVFANRPTRKPNAGFEVLPAGVLGPRHEFRHYDVADDSEENDGMLRQQSKDSRQATKENTRLTGINTWARLAVNR